MRRRLILMAVLYAFACMGLAAEPRHPLLRENQFIADASRAADFMPGRAKDAAFWNPTQKDADAALDAVYRYLEKSTYGEEKNIRGIFKEYRVQIVGYVKNGRKTIYCNFFHYVPGSNEFAYWKKEAIVVIDGGDHFWECSVDLDLGKVFNVYINGYA